MPDPVDELIADHLPAAWRLARVLADSPAEAEDLVQDAFLAAWRRRRDLRDPRAARAWLLRIVVNEHRDGRRRAAVRRRSAARAAADPASPIGRTETRPAASPDERGELERLAADAMAALPPRQREVLHLVAVEGLDRATVAEVLGLTPGNVGATVAIARRKVAAAIAAAEEPGPSPTTGAEARR